MRLSVIIPIFNNKEWLSKCFDSILSQTFTDYEVILVDDISTDGNEEIIKQYEPQFKKKCKGVKFIRNKTKRLNGGTRNVGIAEASGDYIICIDCDDYFIDERVFEDINKNLNNEDVMFLDYKIQTKDFDMNCYQHYSSIEEAIRGFSYALWTKVCKREFLMKHLQKEGTLFEDQGQHYRICLACKSFSCLGRITHVWNRLNSKSISNMEQYAFYRFNFCGEMFELLHGFPEGETKDYLKGMFDEYLNMCIGMSKNL